MIRKDKKQEELDQLEGERGIPSVMSKRPKGNKAIGFVFIALVIIVGSTLAYAALIKGHKNKEAKKQNEVVMTETVPHKTFLSPPSEPLPLAPGPAVAGGQIKIEKTGTSGAPLAQNDGFSDSDAELFSRRLAAPLMFSKETSQTSGGSTGVKTSDILAETVKPPGSLSSRLAATDTPARPAGIIANRNMVLAKGAFIDCVLETRIDSTVPGMTSCVVTRNIYSDNGKVLLIERGSKITGEYQSDMKQGQARIFVLWNRIKTTHGVTVNLDSPGTDPLGGSGMPGYVNKHFVERFGAAILLSMIDDAFATAANLTQRSHDNQTIVYQNTSSTANNMATEALKNTINIPPTLYKNQGERINVLVARDLSFEGVYDVRPE
jgi:type IV secretion system protein VirB10